MISKPQSSVSPASKSLTSPPRKSRAFKNKIILALGASLLILVGQILTVNVAAMSLARPVSRELLETPPNPAQAMVIQESPEPAGVFRKLSSKLKPTMPKMDPSDSITSHSDSITSESDSEDDWVTTSASKAPWNAEAVAMKEQLKNIDWSRRSFHGIKSIEDIGKLSWQKRRNFIALLQADCMNDNWTGKGNSKTFSEQIALIYLLATTHFLDRNSKDQLALVSDMALVCLSTIYKASTLTKNNNLTSAAYEAFTLILREKLALLMSQVENPTELLDTSIENYKTIDHYATE